jgi:hypothetical protein
MARIGRITRVSISFHKLIKDTQKECYKNRKKVLSSEEITSRIAKKVSKEDILYNNYIRL